MGYDLSSERQAEIREHRLEQLRIDRASMLLDIERWSAIPEDLRDGSEDAAIANARRRVKVAEAQIDALEPKHPLG